MNEKPLVSVVMITYGHQDYIRQAIQGVFLQKTNFLVELIIANDASPDNTDEVVNQVIKKAPEHIIVKYTKHSSNLGMMRNFIWALNQARGKYVALCEGDDYWTDKNKLQIQVDFLEQNIDIALCCHNVDFISGEKIIYQNIFDHYSGKYTLKDLSKKNFIPTLSLVFRNHKVSFPSWYHTAVFGDYPLSMLLCKYGDIMFFSKTMGVYRQNVGVWSGQNRKYKEIIELLNNIANEFQDEEVKQNIVTQKHRYIKLMLRKMKWKEIIKNSYFQELPLKDRLIVLIKN